MQGRFFEKQMEGKTEEKMTLTPEQVAEAKALIDSAAAANGNGNGGGQGGWGLAPAASFTPAAQAGLPAPQGLEVPLKIPTPNGGSIRVYLRFGPEAAANPQTIMAVLNALANAGMPLDVWMPKNNWGGRGGNGGGGWGGQQRGGF